MKTTQIFLFALLSVFSVNAQWTDNGDNMTTNDRVGIGLIPSGKFQVKAGTSTTSYLNGVAVHSSTNNAIRSSLSVTSDDNARINLYNNATNLKVLINSTGDSYFNGGKVGIGTTNTANGILTVNGEIGNGIRIENDGLGDEASLRFRSRNVSGDYYHADLSTYHNGSNGFIGLKSPSNNGPGLGYKLIVNDSGNVGIGTTIPDDKLTVKGRIHAEEVKVDLSVPGPDYVFKEGYDLKSLEEVQKHIREKGHLPNIPSAEEMEKNGVELGLMNMKLLEKIEELTLYMIAMNRRMELLEKENLQLKKGPAKSE